MRSNNGFPQDFNAKHHDKMSKQSGYMINTQVQLELQCYINPYLSIFAGFRDSAQEAYQPPQVLNIEADIGEI